MKYLVAVDDCYLDRPNGSARVSWDIAMLARAHGAEVAFVSIAPEDASEGADFWVSEEQGVRILRVKKPRLSKWDPRRVLSTVGAVKRAVHASFGGESWDLLHTHTVQTGLGAIQALGRGVRVQATAHSPMVQEYKENSTNKGALKALKLLLGTPLLFALERQLLSAAKAIHTLSQFTRVTLSGLHPVEQKITIIPHWRRSSLQRTLTKEEARERLGWPRAEKLFFTVRFHGARNGIDLSIRAIAPLLRARKARYYVAGDGPLRPYHESLARELGVEEQVVFMGRISDQVLEWSYQAADAFLLPTRALECFGVIAIEALSFGCPVISSNAAAIPEIMQPILPQLMFPAGDVEAMREKLTHFLDGTLSVPPPTALVDYVERRYGEENIAPQMLDWLGLS